MIAVNTFGTCVSSFCARTHHAWCITHTHTQSTNRTPRELVLIKRSGDKKWIALGDVRISRHYRLEWRPSVCICVCVRENQRVLHREWSTAARRQV